MKVYITKYALTSGVFSGEAEICKDTSTDMAIVRGKDFNQFDQYYHGKNWHKTKEEAIARAETMRENKLVSLKKQIQKIKGIDFKKQIEEA